MFAHVNHFTGFPNGLKGSFYDSGWLANERDYGSIGGRARVYIEEFYALNGFNGVGDLLYDRFVASFRKVRDAFDELFHGAKVYNG
jgi:hypothetical protein